MIVTSWTLQGVKKISKNINSKILNTVLIVTSSSILIKYTREKKKNFESHTNKRCYFFS